MDRFSRLSLRSLGDGDAATITAAFAAQGWTKPAAQYIRYGQEQEAGVRSVLVAEVGDVFAGYVTIVWQSEYPHFRAEAIPEIVDLNVLIAWRLQGIGTALLDAAEACIASRSPIAGIGVGMTPDYGAAQIMYVRRGYVPDGRGLASNGVTLAHGDVVTVDDGLTLYFIKPLRNQRQASGVQPFTN